MGIKSRCAEMQCKLPKHDRIGLVPANGSVGVCGIPSTNWGIPDSV